MRRHPRRSDSGAFAEGRRLRRAAERSRGTRRAHRRVVLWLLMLPMVVAALIAAVVAAFAASLLVIGSILSITPFLLVGGVVYVSVRRRRRFAARSAGTAPLPGRPASTRRPDRVWSSARTRFHALAAQYAAHECDAMAVLRLPALSDVTVPSTGRFVDAFAAAQALESDQFPGETHAADFVRAVDRAERAWRAAREAAQRIRLSGLSPTERSTVERVIKLLTVARDSDSDAERLAAYSRARTELDRLDAAGVIHLPRTARAAIDTAARGSLPA